MGENGEYGALVLQDEGGSMRLFLNPKAVDMERVTTLAQAQEAVEQKKREIEEANRQKIAAWEARTGLAYDPEWRERAKAQEAPVEPEATEKQPSTAMDAQEALNRAGERFRNRRAAEALAQDTALPETGAEGESDLEGLAGNTALSVGLREQYNPGGWGDLGRKVNVVGDGKPFYKRPAPKGKRKTQIKDIKEEVTTLAFENVSKQSNVVRRKLDGDKEERTFLAIDGVLHQIAKGRLLHSANSADEATIDAVTRIGDLFNASIEVPGDFGDVHYRIAAMRLDEPYFVLFTERDLGGKLEVRDVQILKSVKAKKAGAPTQVVTPREQPANTTSVANLKDAWETLFLDGMEQHLKQKEAKPGNTALSVGGFGLSANARAEMEKARKQYEGTDQWMNAPNGAPTNLTEEQWLLVRTPSFKAWFGDWENDPETIHPKLLDENGEPRVFWHNSPAADIRAFDPARSRAAMDIQGTYFSPDSQDAAGYGQNAYPVFIALKHPADQATAYAGFTPGSSPDAGAVRAQELRDQGYDGVIVEDSDYDSGIAEVIVFDPCAIKSATDNVGTFDPENPDIRLSVGERTWRRMEEASFREVRPAEVGRQRRAGAYYPDIGRWIANTALSVGERRKAEYRAVIASKRPDLPADEVERFMGEVEKLGDTKREKAALHWFVRGGLQLPEDGEKFASALKVAPKFKLDPFAFASPDELLAEADRRNPKKQVLPYIDPDTVPELSNKRDLGHGVVVYDVEDSPRGQAAMRRIMNSHLGRNANGEYWSPWCLLTPTVSGGVSESAKKYWKEYAKTGRNAAFKDGKLFAFQSNDRDDRQWWDMEDSSHDNIPVTVAVDARAYGLRNERGELVSGEVSMSTEMNESGEGDLQAKCARDLG